MRSPSARVQNRQIAEAAGITDDDQISSVLPRWRALEPIVSDGARPTGTPHRWLSSGNGEELRRALHRHLPQPPTPRDAAGGYLVLTMTGRLCPAL